MADPQPGLVDKNIGPLTPLQTPQGYIPGQYAAIDVSPEPMFGPDELGTDFCAAIEQLTNAVTKSESAPRIFEVLQTWEARLFDRNYQFNISGQKGWGFFGGDKGPQGIMGAHNKAKLFSANVYGARKDKIAAALSRELPTILFSPRDPDWGPDQTMADESEKYVEVWKQDTDLKNRLVEIAGLFYTDDRVCLWTTSWADEQRWGTEPQEEEATFGDSEPQGVTPENELGMDGGNVSGVVEDGGYVTPAAPTSGRGELPAIAEITTVFGKLEHKVPLIADSENEMGWVRISTEINSNIAKEKYPWIEDKIVSGSGLTTGNDQFDRLARMNVRLAIANASVGGDSYLSDSTESHTWFRPSQYRAIDNKKGLRDAFYQNFPDGLRVTHVGNELAFVRNERLSDKIKILHSRQGSGQNRRAIGTNFLPIQKRINANISLLDRYYQAGVPKRFTAAGKISGDAMNAQSNDPGSAIEVLVGPNERIADFTGLEVTPGAPQGLAEYIQWLMTEAPVAMDGATDAMFGTEDTDTFGAAKLNRDQALQVFGTPWSEICWGLAGAAGQAAKSASQNRRGNIRSKVPGAGRLTVELKNMQGDALAYPESVDIPETLLEQEQRISQIFEASASNAVLAGIVNDPQNLKQIEKFVQFSGLRVSGVDSVVKQQAEFELLLKSGPLPNPQLMQIQQALQTAQQAVAQGGDPTGQAAEMMQQAEQAMQTIPPLVTSVPVAQDASENHAIESAITLAFMQSDEGRKLANGDSEQKGFFDNVKLHWEGHEMMKQKLQPVPPLQVKLSASVALDKLPPNIQAQTLQAAGLQATPEDFHNQDLLIPHETIVEKEGVDENGVPIKTRTALMNPNK